MKTERTVKAAAVAATDTPAPAKGKGKGGKATKGKGKPKTVKVQLGELVTRRAGKVTAVASRSEVGQADQPTAVRGKVTVGDTSLSVSQFVRLCGSEGWAKEDVRKVLDRLAVPVSDKCLALQHYDGRRQADGGTPLYGPVPTDVPTAFLKAVKALLK